MPHYHFHMLNGRPFRDLDGEDLAGEVLRDGEIDVRGAGPFRILCTDTAGAVVTGLIAEEMSAKAVAHMLARLNVGAVQD
ncbi:MAG: hypothetical protein A2093_03055 [Caulobacterales bacterium GWE1_67_11]|jgi:hypothetical protein|nr:MAG: hypothetical protein A2093_03055 [Caulobacterales bacterium GWE1_67_11]